MTGLVKTAQTRALALAQRMSCTTGTKAMELQQNPSNNGTTVLVTAQT